MFRVAKLIKLAIAMFIAPQQELCHFYVGCHINFFFFLKNKEWPEVVADTIKHFYSEQ